MRPPRSRGFTLVELAVTISIAAILAAVAWSSLARQRARGNLAGSAIELQALLRNARVNAVASGRPTAVMVFPQYANPLGGIGRVVVYEDPSFSFFSAAATPHFDGFDPAAPAEAGRTFLGSLDLPAGIVVGLGGAAPPTLAPPYSGILAAACSFCASGNDGRGAVVFDARGRAGFHSADGAPLAVQGGTIALSGPGSAATLQDASGYRLLVITGATGSVRALNNG
ncbi:pilus assembly FimT family protein [Anaeromyxobacter paludicola]|uniref:Prepilin-type N-terminal cleavage/methylation domain-containing protein n=1 Tax=Anaeromyxobacter paludicola TaxID=2918171 RepID=A0ABM7XB69_9BACT|nr:prepilin-type N-terminal cleavage/methylation domain-containing protein [Anaeromyxobacter paludicola]BDG09092.1 hypothetical protein AMPC_22050 [Anaeromyxobacter paludicola]